MTTNDHQENTIHITTHNNDFFFDLSHPNTHHIYEINIFNFFDRKQKKIH